MQAFSRVIGTFVVVGALAAPALAQGRGAAAEPQKPTPTPTTTAPATTSTPKAPVPVTVPPALAAKIQPLLPTGATVETASTGFKNLGQFVAAVHVSKNLDIPFDTLKGKVTGTKAESLGQAIKDLKPAADSSAEVKKAQSQAKADQSGK